MYQLKKQPKKQLKKRNVRSLSLSLSLVSREIAFTFDIKSN
jgi:hypothetical protein